MTVDEQLRNMFETMTQKYLDQAEEHSRLMQINVSHPHERKYHAQQAWLNGVMATAMVRSIEQKVLDLLSN